jgi:hypothetical protein
LGVTRRVRCLVPIGTLKTGYPHIRVKMIGKIPRNTGFVFPYFPVIFVLFGKYGNRYENGIWCHGNRSENNWVSIPSVFWIGWENPVILRISRTVHLSFPTLFIWAGPAIFFLLIQRVFKYSNDSNLQNKKPVLTKL